MQTLSEIKPSDNNESEENLESVSESLILFSEKELDKPNEPDRAKVTMERMSSKESPLKTFIDNFKQKYNISVEQNDIAIFV